MSLDNQTQILILFSSRKTKLKGTLLFNLCITCICLHHFISISKDCNVSMMQFSETASFTSNNLETRSYCILKIYQPVISLDFIAKSKWQIKNKHLRLHPFCSYRHQYCMSSTNIPQQRHPAAKQCAHTIFQFQNDNGTKGRCF